MYITYYDVYEFIVFRNSFKLWAIVIAYVGTSLFWIHFGYLVANTFSDVGILRVCKILKPINLSNMIFLFEFMISKPILSNEN